MIDSAERPVVILGWGARFAADDCLDLAEKIGAPITTTFKAKGIISEINPQSVGVHGSVGTGPSRELVRDSDLLVVLGSSFSAQTGIPSDKPIIQVDYDSMALGKRFPVELSLWGSVEDTVPLLRRLVKKRSNEPTLQNVKGLMEKWNQKIEPMLSSDDIPIHPARVLKALQKEIPDEAMISIDAGDNSWWFGKYFRMSRQKFILSGYLATMAFGFAGALGAAFAYPSIKSIALTGDGAFAMVMADFTTAVKYHLPVVAIVYDNSELSMITHEQASEGFPKYATELINPNFADFADSCGGEGYDVRRPDELESVLDQAMDSQKPCIVNVHTNPTKFWMTEH
jgi:thiamine pyrophosphate-dependent acetolactate synthase large subunit-like protein